jgi:hypothetical protein
MLQVFDVLHMDGRSTRRLPYRERRALLAELGLDGPAWRTPASIVFDEPDEFVSRVTALGMEGAVAKRVDSRYFSGRRTAAWVKNKLRRDGQLAVTGTRSSADGTLEAVDSFAMQFCGPWMAGTSQIGPDSIAQLDRASAGVTGFFATALRYSGPLPSTKTSGCHAASEKGFLRDI